MKQINQKEFEDFLKKLTKLETIEFLGITKILCINLLNEDNTSLRPVKEIIEEMGNRYMGLNRSQRREIQKVLSAATKKSRGGRNGN